MNPQLDGILRAILVGVGGFIAGKGWIPIEMVNEIVGALLVIGGAVWTVIANRPKSLIAAAAAQPDVTLIRTRTADMADSIPNTKVQPATTTDRASAVNPTAKPL